MDKKTEKLSPDKPHLEIHMNFKTWYKLLKESNPHIKRFKWRTLWGILYMPSPKFMGYPIKEQRMDSDFKIVEVLYESEVK